MRTSSVMVALALLGAGSSDAAAAPTTITGEVVSSQGRWSADGQVVVTDAVIRADDGTVTTVVQLGGRADGLGQVTFPAPAPLDVGLRVTVRAHPALDRQARTSMVVEDVRVHAGGRAPFVRTGPTEGGAYLRWASGCVFITYDEAGTGDLAGASELGVLDAAIDTWNAAIDACSYLQLTTGTSRDGEVLYDGINLVLFRDDLWCRPPHDDVPEMCLPTSAAGLTTVTFVDDPESSRDGEIVDADVELNGQDFAIASGGTSLGTPACLSDLGNTFTHELGHVMGFDHTCLAPADPDKLDGEGEPVPLCSQTSDPEITEATMYNFQDCGETMKTSPEPTDVDGVCTAYARAGDPGTCEPAVIDPPGCCSTGGGRDQVGGLLLALGVLVGLGTSGGRGRSRGRGRGRGRSGS